MWQPHLVERGGPKAQQIADAICDDVASGRLLPDTKLPPQRDLAYVLGVSLNTVTRAYADAMKRGFVRGEVGRGTYVRAGGPMTADADPSDLSRPTGPVDFSMNLPAPGAAAEVLADTLADLSRTDELAAFLDRQTAAQHRRHVEQAANWLSRIGLDADKTDIVLASGAQNGILASLMASLRPGDVLLTEALTYAPVKVMARHLGLTLAPVACDGGGLDPEALDVACRRVAARALYCQPTLHTPTTVTMDADRRAAIAAIARKHDLTIIEDDVFGFLPLDRPPPLAVLAPERTIHVTSVSKSMAPGLRVGYVRAPEDRARAIQSAIRVSSWMPAPLMVEIASRWIGDGTADRLNAFQRDEARFRQAMARDLIPDRCLTADPDGFHAWLSLPETWQADLFRMEAENLGVKVLVGGAFAVDPAHAPNAIRLCLSHEISRARVRRGLSIIADLLTGDGDRGSMIV